MAATGKELKVLRRPRRDSPEGSLGARSNWERIESLHDIVSCSVDDNLLGSNWERIERERLYAYANGAVSYGSNWERIESRRGPSRERSAQLLSHLQQLGKN